MLEQDDESLQNLVIEMRNHAHKVAGTDSRACQMEHQGLYALVKEGERLGVAGVGDIEDQLLRRMRLLLQDIGLGNDADQLTCGIHHTEPMNLAAQHAVQGFIKYAFCRDRLQWTVHHVASPITGRGVTLRHHFVAQIAVCQDARGLACFQYDHARNVLGTHLLDNVEQGGADITANHRLPTKLPYGAKKVTVFGH